MASLRLEYTLSREEVSEARALVLRHQVARGSKWGTLAVLLLIIFLVFGTFVLMTPRGYQVYVLAGFVVLWIVVFVLQRRSASRAGSSAVHLDEDGVSLVAGAASGTLKWSAFGRLIESPTMYVLRERRGALIIPIPRRAFPDDASRQWFHARARAAADQVEADVISSPGYPLDAPIAPATTPSAPAATTIGDAAVVVRYRYRFRDFLDRGLVSWFTRLFMVGAVAFSVGAFLYTVAHADPAARPVYSNTQTFFYFVIPFTMILTATVLLATAGREWLGALRSIRPQVVSIHPGGLSVESPSGCFDIGHASFPRYKETPWSFILWHGAGKVWLLIPKRAFVSPQEVARCRQLLASYSKRSNLLVF